MNLEIDEQLENVMFKLTVVIWFALTSLGVGLLIALTV